MKTILKILFALLIVSMSLFAGYGQDMTKAEKKEMKQEKKALKKEIKYWKKNPFEYDAMLDNLRSQIEDLEAEVKDLKAQLKDCNSALQDSRDSVTMLMGKIAQLEEQSIQVKDMRMLPNGMAYQVQVGYYEVFDITEYFREDKYMSYDLTDDGAQYVIGYFENLDEAERFAADIQKMGIDDAWVVNYLNGTRISDEEAEQYRQQNMAK